MAAAEKIYADPSALCRLYIHHERSSRELAAWRRRTPGSLKVTDHGRAEIVNAIALASHRGTLSHEDAENAWAALESDFTDGHLTRADILWRAALARACQLSRRHSPVLGTRTLDVLHVACALELGLSHFLTFDERQIALAAAAGLKIVKV